MHLYFQSVHEEHQMAWDRQSSNWFNLHKQKALAPLHHKKDLLEDLSRVHIFSLICNSYKGHNKPAQFWEFH